MYEYEWDVLCADHDGKTRVVVVMGNSYTSSEAAVYSAQELLDRYNIPAVSVTATRRQPKE